MKTFLAIFSTLFLGGLVLSAPTSKENDETLTITEEFFPDSLAIYTAEHNIVNVMVPLNVLNFEDEEDEDTDDDDDSMTIFFVEADIKENGEKVDQGLYVLKKGHATKLLDHGRDAAASNDESKIVYFGASDGLYIYNAKKNSAEKYGSLNDDIIGIAKENGTDIIYILTADHKVYKVTDDGKVKTKIEEIEDAQQIVLDFSNNLYFIDDTKNVFVYDGDEVKKIENLPENPSYLNLIRPPFVLEDGVPVIADNKGYIAYVNGTSEYSDIDFVVRPSAYGMEAALIQYYGYNKKIYEYNILAIILSEALDELKNYLSDNVNEIRSIATRPRSALKA